MPTANQPLVQPDEFYPMEDPSENGRFAPRTPNMLKEAASKAALEMQARFQEAARILAENKKEMAGMNCGIVEDGDSERKKLAIQKLLNKDPVYFAPPEKLKASEIWDDLAGDDVDYY